jgi:type VI secretion system secreted protein Hcp
MPMAAYLTLPGIKGSAQQKKHAGEIVVSGVSHTVDSELNPLTGLPKGEARHKTLIVTKEIDASSPLLYKAMEEGQRFGQVHLGYQRMPPDGGNEENHATVIMDDVRIAFVRLIMPNVSRPETTNLTSYEEVGLAYESIQWQWHAGGAEGGQLDSSQSGTIKAKFAPPAEAEMRKMIFDFLKSAITGIGAATVKAVKGGK